jgi:hypothetical protein
MANHFSLSESNNNSDDEEDTKESSSLLGSEIEPFVHKNVEKEKFSSSKQIIISNEVDLEDGTKKYQIMSEEEWAAYE